MEGAKLVFSDKDNKNKRIRRRLESLRMQGVEVYRHSLVVEDSQKSRIAVITIENCIKPFRFLYISGIDVEYEFRGKGIGKNIVNTINNYLTDIGVIGVLKDGITYDSLNVKEVGGMYERYGWKSFYHHDKDFLYFLGSNEGGINLDKLYEFLLEYVYA